jgi:short-subunit dehydrogenase
LGELFERQKHGVIVGFSSVAGDLGRRSNYAYGAAKAGLSVFLAGLRARLRRHGIHVITVKPGRVNTPMTASFSKGKFWSTPIDVANDVARAIRSRKAIVYSPSYWRFIVFFLRILPRRALDKMDI